MEFIAMIHVNCDNARKFGAALSAGVSVIGMLALVATPARALINGTVDPSNPVSNAVVLVGRCTGTLIAPDIVLTAGHCIGGRATPPPGASGDWENPRTWYDKTAPTLVMIGNDRSAPLETRRATQYTLPGQIDIMMLRLDRAVDPANAIPMPAVTSGATDEGARVAAILAGEQFLIGGFGTTTVDNSGSGSVVRRMAPATYFSHNLCHSYVTGVGAPASAAAVRGGDSGGPLIWQYGERRFLVGVTQGFSPVPDPPADVELAVSAELCGSVKGDKEASRHTPTFRTLIRQPDLSRPSVAEWLEAMAPQATVPWPKDDKPLMGQVDAGGDADLVIYRPEGGLWSARTRTGDLIFSSRQWGGAVSHRPLMGNVDRDRRADLVIYGADGGLWYAKDADDRVIFRDVQWGGVKGDVPLLGDVAGRDGRAEVLIYRPTNGNWYARDPRSGDVVFRDRNWGGVPGDLPLVADMDGDRDDDLVIFRRTDNRWFALDAMTGTRLFGNISWGAAGDIPLVGNVDDDPGAEIVIYRPQGGFWYARDPRADKEIFSAVNWGGVDGDVPLLHDVNGDGRSELVIYRPDEGMWYAKDWRTGTAIFRRERWGNPR